VVVSPLQRCRSCGAAIIWARSQKKDGTIGKTIPVEPEAVNPPKTGNIFLRTVNGQLLATVVPPAPGLRQAHFVTCPSAARWRKRK
jgi:hypothetical protein